MSSAIEAGLYHPRCKDSHTTYFPGISTADDTWTKEELEEIGLEYQEEQREQYTSRQAEKYGRMAEYSLDPDNKKKYGAMSRKWSAGAKSGNKFIYENTPVHFNDENDYTVHLSEFPDVVNRGLSEAILDVAQKGETDRCEHMHLVNLKTGKLEYYETNGQAGSVGVDFWKYVEEHSETDFAFVHNHNIISSLSEADLMTPIIYQNIPLMIAAQNNGVKYIARRTKDAVSNFYPDFYFENVLAELNRLSRSGTITLAERMKKREELIIVAMLEEFYGDGMVIIDGRKSR